MSLLQASASEVPVIGTKIGGIQEAIIDEYNGLLVSVGDKEGLKKAIETLVTNRHVRKELGLNGRVYIKKKFSIERMVDGNLEIYQKVMSNYRAS